MAVTLALLAGALVGAGLLLAGVGLWPARPSLAGTLAALRHAEPGAVAAPVARDGGDCQVAGWQRRLGRTTAGLLGELGVELGSLRADLAVTGRSLDGLLAQSVLTAAGAGLIVPVLAVALDLAGISVPLLVPVWVTLAVAGLGALLPVQRLRAEAAARRRGFRHALSALLDLIAINMAGGAETEQALGNALRISQGWAFTRLRQALDHARLAGVTAWAALGQLGEELDIAELRQLAGSLALAGDDGARMRQGLTAMATALRRQDLTSAEVAANQASEQMVFPVVLLAIAFVLLLLYPAVTRLLTDL